MYSSRWSHFKPLTATFLPSIQRREWKDSHVWVLQDPFIIAFTKRALKMSHYFQEHFKLININYLISLSVAPAPNSFSIFCVKNLPCLPYLLWQWRCSFQLSRPQGYSSQQALGTEIPVRSRTQGEWCRHVCLHSRLSKPSWLSDQTCQQIQAPSQSHRLQSC